MGEDVSAIPRCVCGMTLYTQDSIAAGRCVRCRLADALAKIEKLETFKKYVHDRLDAAGVPVDPDGPHKAEGCRVGGRLDLVLEAWANLDLIDTD